MNYLDYRFIQFQPGIVDSENLLPLLSLQFLLDENYQSYQRKVLTLPYAFSMVGGLMGLTFSGLEILLVFFQRNILEMTLIKHLFYQQEIQKKEQPIKSSGKVKKLPIKMKEEQYTVTDFAEPESHSSPAGFIAQAVLSHYSGVAGSKNTARI